jgi:predicted 2-oxoglutarate/Fe(II)-dependent dioxygenase YbiX
MSFKYSYWYVNNFYNKKEINQITKFIENNFDYKNDPETSAKDLKGKSKKNANTLVIGYNKMKHLTKDLESEICSINQNNFGYILYPFNNSTEALFNIYDSKQKANYGWHIDSSESDLRDFKLTALLNLSSSHEGGKLHFFEGNEYIAEEFKPGTLLLFKSHINHKVTPITKGVRKTLTLFCVGPKFR